MRSLRLKALLVASLLILHGCADDGEVSLTNRIDAATFTVQTPEGWALHEVPAIDTYAGWIAGSHDTIHFDYGYPGFGGLGNVSESEGTIYFRRFMINGDSAILHKRKVNGDNDEQIELAVYIENSEKTKFNRLYAIDPSSIFTESAIIEIYKTHQFK